MLNVDTTPQYLIDRGLLSVDSILDGDLIVSSAMRRNRNVRVKRKHDVSYLLKQPDDPGAGGTITLRNEAAFYEWVHQSPVAEPMRELLPRLSLFDAERSLVVLELIEEAKPLWSHYAAVEEGQPFPTAGARAAGRAIARLHRTLAGAEAELPWLGRQAPWIMRAHKPSPDLLASLTPANAETIRILQTQEQLSTHLDALRRQWQPSTITHNDIKSDNVLVIDGANGPEVRLVDWELVAAGDPAWDVAGMLQDFILFWISSMQLMGAAVATAALVASAKYKLTDLHPAIRAFWSGYANELGTAAAASLAVRAVAFSAARLIQSAYEIGAAGGSLNAAAILLLQISANVLRDPARARIELYGLLPTGANA